MKKKQWSAPVQGAKGFSAWAYLGLAVTMIVWGMVPVFLKKLLDVFSPTELSFTRFLMSGVLLLLGVLAKDPRGVVRICLEDSKMLILCTIFGPLTAMTCFNFAIVHLSIGTASVFAAIEPVFTYVLAVAAGQELWRGRRLISILVALAGLAMVTFSREAWSVSYWGSLGLAALSPMIWGVNNIIGKDLLKRHSPEVMIATSFVLSSLFLVPTLSDGFVDALVGLSPGLWLALVYCVLSTIVGFTIWYWTLSRLSPSTVAASLYIIPVFSIVAGILFLDETMSALKAIGVATVILGLYLVNVRFR
ncbi:MAG: DMT family transporter [Pseudomonadota bacterium]